MARTAEITFKEFRRRYNTEDACRAEALLGDVLLYERRSSSNPQYSKSQYQQKIQRFANYATRDALTELMGADGADTYLEYVKRYIEIWTEKSTTAPDEDTRKLCDWTLKKERYYNDSDVEIGDRSIEDDCDLLIATAEKEGIEYSYSVIRENGPTVKLNKLNLTLTEGLGLYPVDMAIYRAQLCRTGKPTQEQIETVTAKAQSILDEINLGQWNLDEPTVEEKQIGNSTEYRIRITAYACAGRDNDIGYRKVRRNVRGSITNPVSVPVYPEVPGKRRYAWRNQRVTKAAGAA